MHSLMSVLITFEITKAFKHGYIYMYIYIYIYIYTYILFAINMRKYLRDTKLSRCYLDKSLIV